MKLSRNFLIVLFLTLFLFPVLDYGQKAEKEQVVKIPKEVASVIDSSLELRQTRLDIPLSYVQTLYFPYQNDYYAVFFLRAKNEALGYAVAPEEGKKKETKEKAGQEAELQEKPLLCNVDFFFRIYSLDKSGEVSGVHREIYLPFSDQVESGKYNPEEENFYSFGTLFPPGRYLLSAAAASVDLTKVGLIFQEFYLPLQSDFKKNLILTPPFLVKSMKKISSPDVVINLYKNFFHYATLEIEPYFGHEFSLKEKLDVFYFIMGSTLSEDGRYTFEVSYVYRKGDEEVVKFEPQLLDKIPAPIVSHPLNLKFEDKKLEPGEYTLEILAKDKIGRKEGHEGIAFIIK